MTKHDKQVPEKPTNLIDKDFTNFVNKELFSIIQDVEKLKKELKILKEFLNNLSIKIESITGLN